jgi:hypothetical protein
LDLQRNSKRDRINYIKNWLDGKKRHRVVICPFRQPDYNDVAAINCDFCRMNFEKIVGVDKCPCYVYSYKHVVEKAKWLLRNLKEQK